MAALSLQEYGILGAMNSMANMCGEQLAVITSLVPSTADEDEMDIPQSMDEGNAEDAIVVDQGEELGWEAKGVTYFELQQNSIFLSNQMYMRLGIHSGDKVLIFGHGATAAELTAILACLRLHAVFVPASVTYLAGTNTISDASKSMVHHIIQECNPTCAIIVGENDECPIVRYLATQEIYRYSLIDGNGCLVEEDPSAYYSSFQSHNSKELGENHISEHDKDEAATSTVEASVYQNLELTTPTALYILYTSGSTGISKGVIGTHHGLINRLEYQYAKFPYSFSEVAVRRTPLTFVDSMIEIFAPLISGVPICAYLYDRINQEGVLSIATECELLEITRVTLIPSQLTQWCSQLLRDNKLKNNESNENKWASITHVFVSGEACSYQAVQMFQQCFPNASLVNLYGTTEVTGDVTSSVLYDGVAHALNPLIVQSQKDNSDDQVLVPIGSSLSGNYLFIVNPLTDSQSEIEVLSLDQEGEMLVVGNHVALGYHHESDAIRNRFIRNPFLDKREAGGSGTKNLNIVNQYSLLFDFGNDDVENSSDNKTLLDVLKSFPTAFLTGDMVKFVPYSSQENKTGEGEWVWIGRKDHVVKHHGQKIVLTAVEEKLMQVLAPLQCTNGTSTSTTSLQSLVMLSLPNANDQSILVLVYLPHCFDPSITVFSIKSLLAASSSLAAFERPTVVLPYENDKFPYTPSFKIDRAQIQKEIITSLSVSPSIEPSSLENIQEGTTTGSMISVTAIANELLSLMQTVLQLPSSMMASQSRDTSLDTLTFFAMGGDSISDIELLWQFRHHFNSKYPTASFSLSPDHLQLPITTLARLLHQELFPSSSDISTEGDSSKEDEDQDRPSKKIRIEASSTRSRPDYTVKISATEILPKWDQVLYRTGRSEPMGNHSSALCVDLSSQFSLSPHWKYPLHKCIDASPAVVVGTNGSMATAATAAAATIIGCHGGNVALVDMHSGCPHWYLQLQSSANDADHVEGAIAVDLASQTAFVPTFLGIDVHTARAVSPLHKEGLGQTEQGRGRLWAIDLPTGLVRWSVSLPGECKSASLVISSLWTPVVLVGDYLGNVVLIEISTGRIVAQISELNGTIFASPQILSQSKSSQNSGRYLEVLVCTTRGSIYAIRISQDSVQANATMSTVWQFDLEATCIFSTPAIHRSSIHAWDGILIACTDGSLNYLQPAFVDADNNVTSVSVAWKEEDVSRDGAPFFSSFCTTVAKEVDDPIAVVGNHDGRLRAVSVSSGAVLAEVDLHSVIFASPYLIPLVTSSAQKSGTYSYLVVAASTAGDVVLLTLTRSASDYAFDVVDTVKLPAEVFSSPVVVVCLPADDEHATGNANDPTPVAEIVLGCRDDHVHAIRVMMLQ
jgi:acyl-CoA synthetase (AMP-forming)/AMP-acid ligase II/outer membrane protein assembly factor BamB